MCRHVETAQRIGGCGRAAGTAGYLKEQGVAAQNGVLGEGIRRAAAAGDGPQRRAGAAERLRVDVLAIDPPDGRVVHPAHVWRSERRMLWKHAPPAGVAAPLDATTV